MWHEKASNNVAVLDYRMRLLSLFAALVKLVLRQHSHHCLEKELTHACIRFHLSSILYIVVKNGQVHLQERRREAQQKT